MIFLKIFTFRRDINFVKYFPLYILFSTIALIMFFFGFLLFNINFGVEFTGGIQFQLEFQNKVDLYCIKKMLIEYGFSGYKIQAYDVLDKNQFLIRINQLEGVSLNYRTRILNIIMHESNLYLGGVKLVYKSNIGELTLVYKRPDKFIDMDLFFLRISRKYGDVLNKTLYISALKKKSIIYESYFIKFISYTDNIKNKLLHDLNEVCIKKIEFLNPQISQSYRVHSCLAVIFALMVVFIYIAIRFSLIFSPSAILALAHDIHQALFIFFILDCKFDLPVIGALLTIVGYSINNTVVIYDKIKELLKKYNIETNYLFDIKGLVNKALNDVFSRTVGATITTLFSSLSILLFLGSLVKNFALVLNFGILAGFFSSIFISSSGWVYFYKNKYKSNSLLLFGGKKKKNGLI